MFKEYLKNPLNRRKSIYKFFIRYLENYFKYLLIYFILFPLISPILFINFFKKNKFFFKDFFNHDAVVFIVQILNYKKNSVFLLRFYDLHKVLSRFGLIYLLKNFSLSFGGKNYKKISFTNKDSDFFFNKDYFYYFDKKVEENESNFVLPFYLTKNFYLNKNLNYENFRKTSKKFKIIFSGTSHKEWYSENNFPDLNGEYIMKRPDILEIVKQNFFEKIYFVNDDYKNNNIWETEKEILIVETNPHYHKRKKIISQKKHLELISSSNFFLCMPGSSMPLCYHLIETFLVGTVPILSYNDFLKPKLTNEEALFFSNEDNLISTINNALNFNQENYSLMQNSAINYYEKHLSPNSIAKKISQKKFPLEIYTNVDHTSSRLRKFRMKDT